LPVFTTEEGISSIKPITLIEVFYKAVNTNPSEMALYYSDTAGNWIGVDYQTYYKHVSNFAKALISIGIKSYRCLNILGNNSPEWFYAFLGGIHASVVPVGIYPTNSS